MLIGRYEEGTGRPYLDFWVEFPDLRQKGWVPFLLDTGSDLTMLGPADCQRLLLPPSLHPGSRHVRKSRQPVTGIGGEVYPFLARARLTALAASGNRAVAVQEFRELNLVAPEMTPDYEFASVLGWDFLGRFHKLLLCREADELYLLTPGEAAP